MEESLRNVSETSSARVACLLFRSVTEVKESSTFPDLRWVSSGPFDSVRLAGMIICFFGHRRGPFSISRHLGVAVSHEPLEKNVPRKVLLSRSFDALVVGTQRGVEASVLAPGLARPV